MSYLGRKGAVAPLTSADIPVGIVEGTDIAFLENASGTQNLGGTYSTERMYLNDSYTLTGDVTITGHLALGTIADSDVVITDDGSTRTITGEGTLESGELLSSNETDLTGMTGELGSGVTLGSAVTGSPAITGVGTLTSGSIASTVTGFTGIKIVDSWCVTSSTSDDTGEDTITANWAQANSAHGHATIGSSMTESSGIFIFPATGIWKITFNAAFQAASGSNPQWITGTIVGTPDSFSTTYDLSSGYCAPSASQYEAIACSAVFDVVSTSTHKVRFKWNKEASCKLIGTTANNTFVVFSRIGDT